VHWAIAEGYADKDRIGITGISFGGFCTLAGITFTPGIQKPFAVSQLAWFTLGTAINGITIGRVQCN